MQNSLLLYRGDEFDANFFRHAKLDVDNSFYFRSAEGEETILVPKLNERAASLAFKGTVRAYTKPLEEVSELVKGRTLDLDYSSLPARIFEPISKVCKPVNATESLLKERMVKSEQEVSRISKAASATKKILSEIDLNEHNTESELRIFFIIRALELGMDSAFEPIVGSGKHSALPHYKPAHGLINDFVLFDCGLKYQFYRSDVTRVLFSKKSSPSSSKVKDAYSKAQAVFYDIMDALPNLAHGGELASLSEELLSKHGLPAPIHSIGHGVGLDIHEYPRLNKKYSDPLKGVVIAIEPAAYFKDFGVRFEETVYFDGKKARVL